MFQGETAYARARTEPTSKKLPPWQHTQQSAQEEANLNMLQHTAQHSTEQSTKTARQGQHLPFLAGGQKSFTAVNDRHRRFPGTNATELPAHIPEENWKVSE